MTTIKKLLAKKAGVKKAPIKKAPQLLRAIKAEFTVEEAPRFCVVTYLRGFAIEDTIGAIPSDDKKAIQDLRVDLYVVAETDRELALGFLLGAIEEAGGDFVCKLRLADRVHEGALEFIGDHFEHNEVIRTDGFTIKVFKHKPFRNPNSGNMVQEVDFLVT